MILNLVHLNQMSLKNKISYNGYYIPRFQGIDIDTMEDWKLAEKIFKAEKMNKIKIQNSKIIKSK